MPVREQKPATGALDLSSRNVEAGPIPTPIISRTLLALGVVGQLLLYLSASNVVDVDVFHGMALFREVLASGHFPREDVFAFTPTVTPVVHHEWGTGAVLYALWQGAGWGGAGVNALRYLLVALVAGVSYSYVRRRAVPDEVIALAAPIAVFLLTIAFFSPLRGQAFTVTFLTICLTFLQLDREGVRGWIPPWLVLHLVWLNMHGGFVIGFAAIGATAVERLAASRVRGTSLTVALRSVAHLPLVMAAMGLLTLVNPWGRMYVSYLWRAVSMERPGIVEWAPLWDGRMSPIFLLAFVASVLAVVGAVARVGLRGALDVSGWGFLLVLVGPALFSVRHLSMYAVAWFLYVAPLLARARSLGGGVAQHSAWRRVWLPAVSLAVFLVGVRQAVERRAWDLAVPDSPKRASRWYPVRAVEYLAGARFTGRLATTFADGSYVSWRLHPDVKVSFDTRYEAAYIPGTFEVHEALFRAEPGWPETLDAHSADAVLVPRASPLTAALEGRPREWARVYRDDADSIYVRAPRQL